jgi:hypothetical protein
MKMRNRRSTRSLHSHPEMMTRICPLKQFAQAASTIAHGNDARMGTVL